MKRFLSIMIFTSVLLSSFVNAGAYLTLESRYEGKYDTSNGRTKRDAFYDGFDSGYGASPGGYVLTGGNDGYGIIVDASDEILMENGAFELTDTVPGESYAGPFFNKKLEDIEGNVAWEIKFMVTNSPERGDFGFRLYMDGSATNRPQFAIMHRDMSVRGGGVSNSVGAVKSNKWYVVRFILNREKHEMDFVMTCDGEEKLFRGLSYEGDKITELGIYSQRGDSVVLIDYIKLEENPPMLPEEERQIIEAPRVADPVPHAVYGKINIFMDGRYRYFTNEPIMENERVLIPLRSIFEDMGAKVSYREEDRTGVIELAEKIIEVGAGNAYITVDGVRKETDVAAKIYKDRIYVPVRAISESVGAKVGWIQEEATVTIETPGFETEEITEGEEKEEEK